MNKLNEIKAKAKTRIWTEASKFVKAGWMNELEAETWANETWNASLKRNFNTAKEEFDFFYRRMKKTTRQLNLS